ncbi:hypothetical protein [Hansschlegelia plantiphila]|uniref:DNA packaging protein n=1 Tax=Hansschlegelia plantiphila TaxID=374655 RepID=A0A9W6IXV4_9HYPH|nr:hypothetical protein [Hansschlegelia plantiphila]GLK67037.1 hypothetical protein GCM10008179_06750 [Hansschlegelia plantiphila]
MSKAAFTSRIASILGDDDDPPSIEVVNAAAVGDLVGVTGRRIEQLASDGVILRIGVGRFDKRASVRAYCDFLRAGATGRGNVDKAYRDAKTRAAAAQAEKIETANAVAAGELVSAADVAAAWSTILADVRAAMLAIPSRVQGIDRHAIELLDREIREALEGLADAG